jgi:hypothetical protein
MGTLAELEKKGFIGIDASLEISLFEYGLIWVKGLEGHEKDYHFIYGVGKDKNGDFVSFDWGDLSLGTNPKEEWNWIKDFNEVATSCGVSKEDFLKRELPQIVFDLISYYGYENILGSSYYPFPIEH